MKTSNKFTKVDKETKKREMYTSPVTTQRVKLKRAQGYTKSAIALQEGLSRPTVAKILNDQDAKLYIEQMRRKYIGIGDAAIQTILYHIAVKKDVAAAERWLKNTEVVREEVDETGRLVRSRVILDAEPTSKKENPWLRKFAEHYATMEERFGHALPALPAPKEPVEK